ESFNAGGIGNGEEIGDDVVGCQGVRSGMGEDMTFVVESHHRHAVRQPFDERTTQGRVCPPLLHRFSLCPLDRHWVDWQQEMRSSAMDLEVDSTVVVQLGRHGAPGLLSLYSVYR